MPRGASAGSWEKFAFGSLVLLGAVSAACGTRPEEAPEEAPARTSALSSQQVTAARSAGLLPSGYLQPVWLDALSVPGMDPARTDSFALGVNSGGSVIGRASAPGTPWYPAGQPSTGFVTSPSGQSSLLPPSPAGVAIYPTQINDQGWIAAASATSATAWGALLYSPDHVAHAVDVGPNGLTAALSNIDAAGSYFIGAQADVFGGALAAWHFEGDGVDSVPKANGQPTGPASPNSLNLAGAHFVAGRIGSQALSFDGTDASCRYFQANAANDFGIINQWPNPNRNNGLTIMAWVKVNSCTSQPAPILRRGQQFALALQCGTTGRSRLRGMVNIAGTIPAAYNGAGNDSDSPSIANDGTWVHVAMTWDSHRIRYYLNGQLQTQTIAAEGPALAPANWLFMGGCYDPGVNLNGALDDLAMFRQPLTADQIAPYMNGTKAFQPLFPPYSGSQWLRCAANTSGPQTTCKLIEPPAGTSWGQPYRMNNAGDMVGAYYTASAQGIAAFHSDDLGTINLNDGFSQGGDWVLNNAWSVNESRQIIGHGTHLGHPAAFKLDIPKDTIVDLGHLSSGPLSLPSAYVEAKGINAQGHVVGNLSDSGPYLPQRAFIYTDESGMTDLNDFVAPSATTGWVLSDAIGINDSDVIVGWATNGAGARRAFTLALPGLPSLAQAECLGVADGTSCTHGKFCKDNNVCFGGVCGGGDPADAVCLTADGVVDLPDGRFLAILGFKNLTSSSVLPAINEERLGGVVVADPQPSPPAWFPPDNHPGVFRPYIAAGQQVSWRVNGQQVSESSSDLRHLTKVPIGTSGYGVMIGATLVTVKADLAPYNVAPDQPTLLNEPSGADFKGVLAGQFGVSPSGAATYSVPIAIPPGIAGMAPNLSLAYTSQGGDGIAGQGWQLTGLSMIHRCPKTRVQDGISQSVSLADDDGVCLDGKRLFADPDVFGPGPTELTTPYRLETEEFSTISAVVGLNPSLGVPMTAKTFIVVTKTGETRYYGSREDSRVGGPVYLWALDKVVDSWGNYYEIHYNSDSANFADGLMVTQIDYTGHPAVAAQCGEFGDCTAPADPETRPFQHVKFGYEARPDVRSIRFGSAGLRQKKRLQTIDTGLGTYVLRYLDPDLLLPTRLSSIEYYCASAAVALSVQGSTCLEPLIFDWDGGGYGWEPASVIGGTSTVTQAESYLPPVNLARLSPTGGSGTRFVDLDGDGRMDIVMAISRPRPYDSSRMVWWNNGHGWTAKPSWAPPRDLVTDSGEPSGGILADLDGDGVLDLAFANSHQIVPDIYINHIPTGGTWAAEPGFLATSATNAIISQTGADYIDFRTTDTLRDMNGDGKADWVRFGPGHHDISVAHSTGHGWTLPTQSYVSAYAVDEPPGFHLEDINRDGLPDVVSNDLKNFPIYGINSGSSTGGVWWWKNGGAVVPPTNATVGAQLFGDVDGDGLQDSVVYVPPTVTYGPGCNTNSSSITIHDPEVKLATGTGWTTDGTENYVVDAGFAMPNVNSAPVGPNLCQDAVALQGTSFSLADVNGDGLVDFIGSRGDGGRLLVNTGTNWADINGEQNWQKWAGSNPVPAVPSDLALAQPVDLGGGNGATFVDFDGDGLEDLVDAFGTSRVFAWRNTFRAPVIKGFPNGLASNSQVGYEVITTAAASEHGTYSDHNPVEAGTRVMAAPLRVVASVTAMDGTGITSSPTTYQYESLRSSTMGRGPLGFRKLRSIDQASKITSVTTFSQSFPYAGMPISIERYFGEGPAKVDLTSTVNEYCDTTTLTAGVRACTPPTGLTGTLPPRTTRFVYPFRTTQVSHLSLGESVTTTSEFTYDSFGNPLNVDVTVVSSGGEKAVTKTENVYDDEYPNKRKMGKVTKTTVTATREIPPDPLSLEQTVVAPISHVTSFEYEILNGVPVMVKKSLEPNAGVGVRVDTAFGYDNFGNVKTTTACADAFASCSLGSTASPLHRTTKISYDPAESDAPNSLGYSERGRFVVKATNALNQSEYSAYAPLTGKLVRKTGPNGISTCYGYDATGRQTSETSLCTAVGGLTTTIHQYMAASPAPAKVVTVTRPPTGGASFVYTDALGKTVATTTRSFDGGFTESSVWHDVLGRVSTETKPHRSGDPGYQIIHEYDDLGRPSTVTDQLGDINGTGTPSSSLTTMAYDGSTVTTSRIIRGATQTRSETKNVLGKVASVKDANLNQMFYEYDAEGNLTKTKDDSNNVTTIGYDARGRKSSVDDPDLGAWSYVYNGFGEVLEEHAPSGVTTMTYDVLGRMVTKSDALGTTEWVYDTAPGAGVGKLAFMRSAPDPKLAAPCSAPSNKYGAQYLTDTSDHRTTRAFTYTSQGDVASESQCVDGDTFVTSYGYDAFDRQDLIQYPAIRGSRLSLRSHFTSVGYLDYIKDDTDNSIYWAAKEVNALGQVTVEQTKNGVKTTSVRNPSTGWLLSRSGVAQADGSKLIQNWEYQYDEAGDLMFRRRSDTLNVDSSEEIFTYDPLNRLKTSQVRVLTEVTDDAYEYDGLGNLTKKGGKSYTYFGCMAGSRSAGPHAVCTVEGGGAGFVYDMNGNMISGSGRTIQYNAGNKPTRITSAPAVSQGNDRGSVDFVYGADGNRVLQDVVPDGGTPARTVYVGLGGTGKSVYERTIRGNKTEHVQYLYAGGAHGGAPFALRMVTETSTSAWTADRYYHYDHLGSVTAMSDEMGHVVDAAWGGPDAGIMGYDAWGARRGPDGRAAPSASFNQQPGRREFTGHETIESIGLVNMNGRVYDPVLGRFLSPDPNVQFVGNLQSHNRYSYVHNNPLTYTDPTGYWISPAFDSLVNIGLSVAAITVCATSAGAGCAIAFAVVQTVYNASSARHAGASWEQIIETSAMSMIAASISASIANAGFSLAVDGPAATSISPLAALLAGTTAGAYMGMFNATMAGGKDLGSNIVKGAAQGIIWSSVALAVQYRAQVSQASAAEAQGGGEGSGNPRYLHRTAFFTDTASGTQQAIDPEGSMANFITTGESPLLESEGGSNWHRLTHTFKEVVRSMESLGVDLDSIRVNDSTNAAGQGGITFWNHVFLKEGMNNADQAYLLTHEMVHSPQWSRLGPVVFLVRYGIEQAFLPNRGYGDPAALAGVPVGSMSPVGRDYSLDGAADHVQCQFFPGAGCR
jgi:RHS repeat-associated protein